MEEMAFVINSLSIEQRLVLTSKLQGKSTNEISSLLDKSDRTVRRLLAEAKKTIEDRLVHERPKEASTKSQLSDSQTPLKFSDYILEKLIGAGGMGKVFRATRKSSGTTVAIKALHKSRQSDLRAVSQFVQEAQILAKLRHPNIVGVDGLGKFPGGGLFMVMDFVDGVDLQSRLQNEPLILSEAIAIVKPVIHAISYAHENGIVHCDLKPGNVLLDKDGRASVTDFGFAFLVADSSSSALKNIGGSVGYIAPEILRLQSPPTPAADIYAIGVLLRTLVTGGVPEEPSCTSNVKECLGPVAEIAHKCLANEPKDRYPTAEAILNELESITD